MLNCQQVTRLIERQADQPLSWGTQLAMRVHLRLCFLCRRYQSQTALITRVARQPTAGAQIQLRNDFKEKLRLELKRRSAENNFPPPAPEIPD